MTGQDDIDQLIDEGKRRLLARLRERTSRPKATLTRKPVRRPGRKSSPQRGALPSIGTAARDGGEE